jgi:hypothetical protein
MTPPRSVLGTAELSFALAALGADRALVEF